MEVRALAPDEVHKLGHCAEKFYASSKHLDGFDLEQFSGFWAALIMRGDGVIFALCDGDEMRGALGGITHQDPYHRDKIIAQEFYWFVLKESRGSGVRLYRAFEKWARERGAHQLRMGYLVDLMPNKVKTFYEFVGLHPVEVVYSKDLNV